MKVKLLASIFLTTTFIYADNYKIVDTGQETFYDNNSSMFFTPKVGDEYYGQDANYLGNQFNYTNNGDGTISDNVTGLMWAESIPSKLTYSQAIYYAKKSTLGGYNDWRIPSIKELYSLINFSGRTGKAKPSSLKAPSDAKPYLDTDYFDFEYPNERRYIDAQYWTSTDYVSTTMNGSETFFGVNFADGRIKGYPKYRARHGSSTYYLRLVRENKEYGVNKFVDANNGTIVDLATNLQWMKDDSKKAMNWKEALNYCESLSLAGDSNWRLPNAKELHSIVDYTRSPDTTNSAAIHRIFNSSAIRNEGGQKDFASYWTSTSHLDGRNIGEYAVYISFGRALGYMSRPGGFSSSKSLMDVHGAGSQRSDPKSGSASRYSQGHGPQGDVVRIQNYVRCVGDSFTNIDENSYLKRNKVIRSSKEQSNEDFKPKELGTNNEVIRGTHPLLDRFDRNRDKKISKDEAPRMMRENFSRHDLNKDGYISGEEINTLPKPPRR